MATYTAKKLTISNNGDEYIIDPLQGNDVAYMEFTVNIGVNDWTELNGIYTYIWTNMHVTQNCYIQVHFKDGIRDGLVGDLTCNKTTGRVIFTTDEAPIGVIKLLVRVVDVATTESLIVSADLVETDAVIGETNVQGALEDLNNSRNALTEGLSTEMTERETADQAHDLSIANLQNELGIVCNGDKTAVNASVGQYVILKNSTINGCNDGLYTAAKAITANTVLDSTYLTSVSGGGLNALNTHIATLAGRIKPDTWVSSSTNMVDVPSNGHTLLAFTYGGVQPAITNSTYGAILLVKNSEYGIIFKGSGITITEMGDGRIRINSGTHNQTFVILSLD